MQSGSLTGGDVRTLTSRVTVDGVTRAHESWSTDRDIVGDLPEQVVSGGGIQQATGTIVWADQPGVSDGSLNPWNVSTGWVPVGGQQVVIYVGDGVREWVQFNGRIDVAEGDIGDGVQSSIVGFDDAWNKQIEHSTVVSVHPPTVEGGARCTVSMGPGYVVDRAMRACGYYATPPISTKAVVSVPAQLSMWPEFGTVRTCTNPVRTQDDYGWWVGTVSATYVGYRAITRTSPVELTMMVSPSHAGTSTLACAYGTMTVGLVVDPDRTARATYNGATLASVPLGANQVVSLLVRSGVWTLKTKSGQATAAQALPAGADLVTVNITGTAGASAAGFQLSTPAVGEEFAAIGFSPTFNQRTGGLSGHMDVLRSYQRQPAIDVLTEISKATLAPLWIDETGRAKMRGSDVLREQAPVQTVTTLDDITKLGWSINQLDTRSSVTVKYLQPAVSTSIWSNITLWQGAGDSMESNQSRVMFATEPADEDWAESGYADGTLASFNRGWGSWYGDYVEDASGTWAPTPAGAVTTYGIQTLGTETTIFQVDTNTLPSGKSLVLKTPEDAANYSKRMQGFNMPVLRGRCKVMWADNSVTSAIRGPSTSPQLIHETGPWLSQTGGTILQDRVADFIASQVSTPHATITGMEVIYDPRRQLGDVITISSPNYMGVEMTALIVGVSNAAGGSFTQSLDVRIISAVSTFTTYAGHEAAYPDSLSYEQWQALYPDATTYEGFNADPLRGAS